MTNCSAGRTQREHSFQLSNRDRAISSCHLPGANWLFSQRLWLVIALVPSETTSRASTLALFGSRIQGTWAAKVMRLGFTPSGLVLFMQGVQPPTFSDFSYFSTKFLLFPTFWLLKAKFFLIFYDFLEILQLFFDFVSRFLIFRLILKILENFLDFEDFRKFLFNFQKMSLFLTSEIFELCSVTEIVNNAKSFIAAKILFEIASSK